MKHQGESGTVKGKAGKVVWTMTDDEAEEIADYIERSSEPYDLARVDVAAIRAAVARCEGDFRPNRAGSCQGRCQCAASVSNHARIWELVPHTGFEPR